ncbi:Cytochrome c-550 [Halomicronema hongdechloris C2206]|uniref:Photosystem II extrinsic protein V n=1 Tax=Halomicronema hongdechloris C2206 TaxID=1641165 RepID=A0A1Z3HIF0_9CYAN|nr:Cytochrome c-550 [Halomicronema hongdechloris C2206]
MLRRCIWLVAIAVFFVSHLIMAPAIAAELDEATRTVKLNPEGDTLVLSQEQVIRGRNRFNNACGSCHVGGITKTNPTVGLEPEALAGALPPRDNIEALVAFLKEPTTYDGMDDISQIHPSIESRDIFPQMRNLTEEDLVAIAGHILLQPKIIGDMWGAGKTRYSAP